MGQIYYAAWREIDGVSVSLEALRRLAYNKSLKDRKGLHVYILRRTDGELTISPVMYVGQTVGGVWRRIQKHIKERSPIGNALVIDRGLWMSWNVEIIEVDKNLDFAERYYIEKFRPVYNQVLNSQVEPDISDLWG